MPHMNKKRVAGILISLSGIALMGYNAGVNDKLGTYDDNRLMWIGLAIVFVGIFIVFPNKKDTKP